MFNKFLSKNRAVFDNVEKYGKARQDTDNNTIRRMRVACWITKATDTYSFSSATVVTRTSLSATLYVLNVTCLVDIRNV
jgi:hypothetical protein